jgi:NADPH:quinone reductase-like Zn-dependent oxidoreductase
MLALKPFDDQMPSLRIPSKSEDPLFVLKDLIQTGKLTPIVDRTFPLSQVPEAIRYLEAGHAQGKIVITV